MTSTGLSIADLRRALRGRVIELGDSDYDVARTLYMGEFDFHPAAIVKTATADDVAAVVNYARSHALELAIRAGGHSVRGHSGSEGGIVIDLSEMKSVDIDPEARTAWAEGGVTAEEYTKAAAVHGLATGFGDTGSVGVAGLVLGGGIGWLTRKHGLTIDDVLAAEVVTADGEILLADPDHHPDLFWALRGGGGNFGVVTRFQFRLHEVDSVLGGQLMFEPSARLVAAFVSEMESAPEELSSVGWVAMAPPLPFVPEQYHGKLVFFINLVFAGGPGEGTEVVDRFRKLGPTIVDTVERMEYAAMFGEEPDVHPLAAEGATMFLDYLDEAGAQTIIDCVEASTAEVFVAQIRVLGGAVARVSSEATAFAHRQSRIMLNVAALFGDLSRRAEHEAWANELIDSIQQSDEGAYVNFLVSDDKEQVRKAYPEPTWDRLREIKNRYDPTNLFSRNYNIPPNLYSAEFRASG